MSNRALTWARKLSAGSPAKKAVLFVLADRASNEDETTIVGQETIAIEAEVSERTVRAVLAEFESAGMIEREKRRRPDGYRTSDRIRLKVGWEPPPTVALPEDSSPEPVSPEVITGSDDQDERHPEGHRQSFPRKSVQTSPEICADLTGSDCRARKEPPVEPPVEPPDTRAAQLALVRTNGFAPPARVRPLRHGSTSALVTNGYPPDFETWYQLYPRKRGKADAAAAWPAARQLASWDELMDGLGRSIEVWEREKTPPDKIPYPATWLNKRRWEDEPDIPLAQRSEPRSFDGIRRVMQKRGSA